MPFSLGERRGGSPCTTCVSCSKTEFHLGYGKLPVASSIRVMPRDHTSERTSYPRALAGSMRSGCKEICCHPYCYRSNYPDIYLPLVMNSFIDIDIKRCYFSMNTVAHMQIFVNPNILYSLPYMVYIQHLLSWQ